jgi:AraC family transcriptional regulator
MELSLLERVQKAMNYIEAHLHEDIVIEKVAQEAFMSQASFYTIFSKMFDTTIKDYIVKRRLTFAARSLIESQASVLEIALDANYKSYEAFSRKFKKEFRLSPSAYRKRGKYVNTFPAIMLLGMDYGGKDMAAIKNMSAEMLNANIKKIASGYLMDVDIDRFALINENYGREVGDYVILEVSNRIQKVIDEMKIDATLARVGGDEFAVVLKNIPEATVEAFAKKMLERASKKYTFKETSLEASISIGIAKYDSEVENDVKALASDALIKAKMDGRNQYCFN